MLLSIILNLVLFHQLAPLVMPESEKPIFVAYAKDSEEDYVSSSIPLHKTWYFPNGFPVSGEREQLFNFPPIKKNYLALGVALSAKGAVLLDQDTKAVLYEKNAHIPQSIASITKLVSALVILDLSPDLDGKATLASEDFIPNYNKFIRLGEGYTFRDLFYTGVIASDNNAIMLLSKSLGVNGEDFAKKMNEKAKEIGMKNSFFVEPTGLNFKNISTPYDVALLLDFSFQKDILRNASRLKKYTIYPEGNRIGRLVYSTDKLLDSYINEYPYSLEIAKTGFIDEAGYCFSAVVSNKDKKGKVIAVVLGAKDSDARFQELKGLVTWGFENYDWVYELPGDIN